MSDDKKKDKEARDKELQEFVVLVRQINKLALEQLKARIEGINKDLSLNNAEMELLKFALSLQSSSLSGFIFNK